MVNMQSLERTLDAAIMAAMEGGKQVLAHKNEPHVLLKANGEPYTSGDTESQEAILKVLSLQGLLAPEYGVIAEEKTEGIEALARHDSKFQWIIDPLDGTKAFIAGSDMVTVCIALVDQETKQTLLGVVYNPFSHKVYAAMQGTKATLNGNPLTPSTVNEPSLANVLVDYTDGALGVLNYIRFLPFKEIERTLPGGSTALKMCLVAEGVWDAYLFIKTNKPKLWDIMASEIIVRQSGGKNLTLAGDAINPQEQPPSMYVTNGRLPMFRLKNLEGI